MEIEGRLTQPNLRKRRGTNNNNVRVGGGRNLEKIDSSSQDKDTSINLRLVNGVGEEDSLRSSGSSSAEMAEENYPNDNNNNNNNGWSGSPFNSWKDSVDIERGSRRISSDNFEETKFESILKDGSVGGTDQPEQSSSSNNNSNDSGHSNRNINQSDMASSSSSSSGSATSENYEQNDDELVNIIARPQTGNSHHHTTKATGMSVRCHCNLASCVTNNYMCKSERRLGEDGRELEAGCFVQELESESASFLSSNQQQSSQQSSQQQQQPSQQQHGVSVPVWNGRVVTARRGCMDMLSREKQEMCSDETGSPIHCCTQDMCNYPKSFYPSSSSSSSSSLGGGNGGSMHHMNNNRLTFDPAASSSGGIGLRGGGGGAAAMTPNLDHQVWLRAAVIAVPICGLMILVALIIVARRLLKSDDYKDPDGRRIRRKFLPSHCPVGLQHSQSHQVHSDGYFPPPGSLMDGSGGLVGSNNRTFHVKPVYVETSEYLLPPETTQQPGVNNPPPPPCCSVCHQRLANPNVNQQAQQHNQRSHYNNHNENNSSFSFAFRKNNFSTASNSETEELVNSSNSSGNSPLQNCHCGTDVGSTLLVSGLGRQVNGYSDCESVGSCPPTMTNSVQPHDFFSKIGLGGSSCNRSAASDNGRPSHV